MSMDRINSDLLPVDVTAAADGPRLGFLDALTTAYDNSARSQSVDGLAWYLSKLDDEQGQRARERGYEYTPLYQQSIPTTEQLPAKTEYGWRSYYRIAKQIVDGEESDMTDPLIAHTRHIAELNSKDPTLQLQPMSELLKQVQKEAQSAQQRDTLSKSVGGYVGSFIGDMAAGVNPTINLPNALTLPVGGFGKSVVARMATQAGGQGVIEAVNQFTGVQENRRLLGLDYGVPNALWNIAGATVGGAVFQGAGEAVAAGVRRLGTGRWFNHSEADPAPPAPATPYQAPVLNDAAQEALNRAMRPETRSPLYRSNIGQARAEQDMMAVTDSMRDWGGREAWDIRPPATDTRAYTPPTGEGFKLPGDFGRETVDSIARRIDPELFTTYDKLANIKNSERARLDALGGIRDKEADAAVADINDKIDALTNRMETATRRNAKKYSAQIEELVNERDTKIAELTKGDNPQMAIVREQLMKADYAMRDLAPAVSRAYGRARGKWDVYSADQERIAKMIRNGQKAIGDDTPVIGSHEPNELPQRMSPIEHVAELRNSPPQKGETLAKASMRINAENDKVTQDLFDQFSAQVSKTLADDAQGGVPHVNDLRRYFSDEIGKEDMSAQAQAILKRMPEDLRTAMFDAHNSGKGLSDAYDILDDGVIKKLKKDVDPKYAEALAFINKEAKGLPVTSITIRTDAGEHTLDLATRINVPDESGEGFRQVTVRDFLKEVEDDNNMLKAVSSCSLKGTS